MDSDPVNEGLANHAHNSVGLVLFSIILFIRSEWDVQGFFWVQI
jgi:hypothetical protein